MRNAPGVTNSRVGSTVVKSASYKIDFLEFQTHMRQKKKILKKFQTRL